LDYMRALDNARLPSVSVAAALQAHSKTFEPLHLPSSLTCSALCFWTWKNGLRRIEDLVGDVSVEVCNRTNTNLSDLGYARQSLADVVGPKAPSHSCCVHVVSVVTAIATCECRIKDCDQCLLTNELRISNCSWVSHYVRPQG
jgi:hypothetical protein